MAIRSREELMDLIRARVGDDTSDEAIGIIEDVTDTLDDYDTRIADAGDWKARYEQNDKDWREKYTARFFAPAEETGQIDMIDNIDNLSKDGDEEIEVKTYDELFKEGE